MHGLSVMSLARLARSNVDHQRPSNGRSGETGAVASLVAILFGTGVLLGLGALVIDTGSLLFERRQLQNGADAAALALAKDCATGPCIAPETSAGSALVTLTGANAADHESDIASVCGSQALHDAYPVAFPTVCPTPATPGLVECPYTTSTAKYVEVRTSTRSGDGTSTILPPVLSQMLAGANGQYSSTTVKACARVGWGNSKLTGPVLPIAMSYCEWKAATGADPGADPPIAGTFVTPPDYSDGVTYGYDNVAGNMAPPWPGATEKEIYTAASNPAATCTTWNGHVAPGNFGALDQNGSCSATASDWISGDTGNDTPCTDAQLAAKYRGKIAFIPLFDCVASSTVAIIPATNCQDGGQAYYHITGYAAFYITGWQFSGTSNPYDKSVKDNHQLCHAPPVNGNNGRCLSGWFTRKMANASEIDDSGAPDFGAPSIFMLG